MAEQEWDRTTLALAAVYAEIQTRLAVLQGALIQKGLLSQSDFDSVMSAEERDHLRVVLIDEFLEKAERLARENPGFSSD